MVLLDEAATWLSEQYPRDIPRVSDPPNRLRERCMRLWMVVRGESAQVFTGTLLTLVHAS